jgi:HSP20 family protein
MRIRELVPLRSREKDQLSRRGDGDPFTTLQTEMSRLFDSFFEGFDVGAFGKSGLATAATMPKVDVSETNDAVHVTAELPGMKEEDIELTLSDGSLIIQGEKRAEKEDKNKNYYRVERSYGTFHRSIPLPSEVDDKKVDASFKDGVLNIVLPKVALSPAAAKKIQVRRQN